MEQKNKGITLISLIITIIVMLILVGIALSIALNEGAIVKTEYAVDEWKQAQQNELNQIDDIDKTIAQYAGETPGETTISKDVDEMENNNISYIGYFADVDNDGEVDGVDRFYVMALEDFTYEKTKNNGTEILTEFCWYAGANYTNLIDNLGLSTDFGTGEANTSIMKQTWKSSDNADKKNTSEDGYLDIWGVLNDDDWFVPSNYEWTEFLTALGINKSTFSDFNFITNSSYWLSSRGSNYDNTASSSRSVGVGFFKERSDFPLVGWAYLELNCRVRLSTTF